MADNQKLHDKQLQNYLHKIAEQTQKIERALDGTLLREQQAAEIGEAIQVVRSQLLPARASENLILYSNGRAQRSFETEHLRLWNHALQLYLNSYSNDLPPAFQEVIRQSISAEKKKRLLKAIEYTVKSTTLPILESQSDSCEDLYLFICGTMQDFDDNTANKIIAKTGKTPPEINCAFYSMFGLLSEAKKSADNDDLPRAYSFLLDANHLLGMHEAAHYTMQRLDAVSAKRQASKNSAKSRKSRQDGIQAEARELFFSLRKDANNGQQPWKSAREATDRIWNVLTKGQTKEAGLGYKTLQTLCRMWHKQELEGPEPKLTAIIKTNDGRSLTLPIN